MASCEMCGKQATTKARIEGTVLVVCSSCASFGTQVQQPQTLRAPARHSLKAEESSTFFLPDFGSRLRSARQKLQLNEEDAAKKLGIQKSTLLHFEAGKLQPDDAVRKRLERFYNISLTGSLQDN